MGTNHRQDRFCWPSFEPKVIVYTQAEMNYHFKIITFIAVLLLSWLPVSSLAQVQKKDLHWKSFEEAIHTADSTGKHILVDIWAPWCGWCHKMKTETYPQLSRALNKNFVLARLNRDDHQTTYRYSGQTYTAFKLTQNLKVERVPAIVIMTSDGEYLLHLSGYKDSKTLRPILRYIASGAYRKQSFSHFQQ